MSLLKNDPAVDSAQRTKAKMDKTEIFSPSAKRENESDTKTRIEVSEGSFLNINQHSKIRRLQK